MRHLPIAFVLLASCADCPCPCPCASPGPAPLTIVQPGQVKWEAAPGFSGGMMTTIQYGDPVKGPYQALIKFPAGAAAQPHFHKVDEFATVASGTLLLGTGETVDESKAVEVTAGGYVHIPAGVAHWAKCTSDSVIVRFAPGPRELTPCSPEKPAPNKAAAPKGVTAKDVKWSEVPELAKGAMRHDPYGDGKKEPHVFTLKFPAGVVRPPHWHGADECVTVLSGKILFGQGEKLDEKKAVEVPAGGYVIVPAKLPHWLLTKEEAVFTVTVNGPRDIFYVNR